MYDIEQDAILRTWPYKCVCILGAVEVESPYGDRGKTLMMSQTQIFPEHAEVCQLLRTEYDVSKSCTKDSGS